MRQIPRAAWICALVALINAVCWSLITPPFQVPDEPDHFAYVQQLAETATLPPSNSSEYSPEEVTALRDLSQSEVRAHPETRGVATSAEEQLLQRDLARPLRRSGAAGAGVATSEPPLFYALQTIPYGLGSSGSLLDRLELMRLLSAVMAALTALFAYMFVREALPRFRWAWAVGGLGVALWPLLGFMSGAVNPDAMLYAVSAAIFYLLARGFRRGLTPGLAAAIGAATAIGLLTKLNFVGLTPGIALGLVVLALRAARTSRRSAYRSLALGVGIAASPVLAYLVINLFSNHAGLGAVSAGIQGTEGSVFNEISYIWQYYLPRLPGMAEEFPDLFTPRLWFERSVGQFGWLDTTFPTWVYDVALIPAALLAILGIRALVTSGASLRSRAAELAVYAAMAAGLLALIAANSYIPFGTLRHRPTAYWQARYLLPLIPLLGAALVLSARGAGRRWGPVAGALIVVLFLAHDVFSQLQVISRFYG
jgi:4-amino-4-deoxy-L-arabinose transferase-like glycosyltransferase